jgi:hypothetical protein
MSGQKVRIKPKLKLSLPFLQLHFDFKEDQIIMLIEFGLVS